MRTDRYDSITMCGQIVMIVLRCGDRSLLQYYDVGTGRYNVTVLRCAEMSLQCYMITVCGQIVITVLRCADRPLQHYSITTRRQLVTAVFQCAASVQWGAGPCLPDGQLVKTVLRCWDVLRCSDSSLTLYYDVRTAR